MAFIVGGLPQVVDHSQRTKFGFANGFDPGEEKRKDVPACDGQVPSKVLNVLKVIDGGDLP